MIIPRRRFLGSTAFMLGSSLLDRLTTPLWAVPAETQVKTAAASTPSSPVQFVDVAERARRQGGKAVGLGGSRGRGERQRPKRKTKRKTKPGQNSDR